jgi:hypothetical protein
LYFLQRLPWEKLPVPERRLIVEEQYYIKNGELKLLGFNNNVDNFHKGIQLIILGNKDPPYWE